MSVESSNAKVKTSTKIWAMRITLLALAAYLITAFFGGLYDCDVPLGCMGVIFPIIFLVGLLTYGIVVWVKPKSNLMLLILSIIGVAASYAASTFTAVFLWFGNYLYSGSH